MQWMILPFRRYADFNGRSRRVEYWMFTLFQIILVFVSAMLFLAVMGTAGLFNLGQNPAESQAAVLRLFSSPGLWLLSAVIGIYWLFALVPSIAVTVRRLHDRDLSGWWYLGYFAASIIPLLNFIVFIAFLVVLLLPGTPGPNRFGEDPKDPTAADVFA